MDAHDALARLHDATLRRITADWPGGRVEMAFTTTADGEVRIVVEGFTELRVPRRLAWGPSNSVLAAGITGQGTATVSVEMQSGDVLVVRGDAARICTG